MRRGRIFLGVFIAVAVVGAVVATGAGEFLGPELTDARDTPSATESLPSNTRPSTASTNTPGSPTLTESATPTESPTPTPMPRDPDRDNLPTRYEESIGTDPKHKTVLLAVEYTGDASRFSDGDRSFLRAKFEELKVTNPDGTTGVDFRIVEEWNTSPAVTVNRTSLRQRALSYLAGRTEAEPCRHHYLVVGAPDGKRWGIAATGGWSAIVKSSTTGFSGSREDVVVHELLHNLVGRMDPSREGVRPDGAHTTSGWLQPKAEMAGPSSLHHSSREVLNERGFANIYSSEAGCV